MIANFHTHTPRCHHAVGTEAEYVRCALDAGVKTLGFSDHTPYPFPDGYVSCFRMEMENLAGYADAVLALRRQYAGLIEIPLGVEAEFYPKFFADMMIHLRDHGIEYMILGQHCLHNEMDGPGAGGPTADAAMLRQYCNQSIDALYTGLFTYFAHPDLMWFEGDEAVYRREMGRLCRAAKACDVPLEINLLGIVKGRNYPDRRFWEIAAKENCKVVLGCDAHDPQMLLDTAPEQKARKLVSELSLELLETVPLRPIG